MIEVVARDELFDGQTEKLKATDGERQLQTRVYAWAKVRLEEGVKEEVAHKNSDGEEV